ncbi:MAG: diaminopimelate epimerase [Syntrophobacteraceae bacterium]
MQPTPFRIPFLKMTGAGNDFIVIDNRAGLIDADNCRDLVQMACRRKLSVGADGMILIENDPEVDFRWRFFNADGSEAEMCGNGARCAMRFAHLKGIIQSSTAAFRTLAGIIHAEMIGEKVKVRTTTPNGLERGVSLDVAGKPFTLDFINTGVPHAVCILPDAASLEAADIHNWGRAIRFHERFQPAGTNVNFVAVLGPRHIRVRTYERGVEAETLACGTGSIASVLTGALGGALASPVEVETRSGESLTIHFIREDDSQHFTEVHLEGRARVVYAAELWEETLTP